MTRLHIPINLLLLLHPFATLAIPTTSLFNRQSSSDTCPSSQSACPDLPSGLCCPSGTDCIPLAGKTTVLCCTEGTNCDRINPITCNIEQQDPDKNPRAPIKTSVFDVDLEKCGDGTCCPYGFSCHEGKQCRMNDDQEEEPGKKKNEDGDVTSTSTSASAEPTETRTDGPSSTGTGEARESATSSPSDGGESDNQNEGDDDGGSSGPDTTTIIGGVVGGIAALLALAIILFVCARRRANRKPSSSSSSSSFASNAPVNNSSNSSNPPSSRPSQHARNFSNSSGPRGNIISEPIMQQNSYRTDFMLKTTPATASTSAASTPHQSSHENPHPAPLHLRNSVHPHISTIRDHDDPFLSPSPSARTSIRSSTTETNNNGRPNSRLAPIRAMRPQQHHRAQPSSESINIFADPGTVDRQNRYSMGTTVSGLMVDLRGEERRPNVPGTTPRI